MDNITIVNAKKNIEYIVQEISGGVGARRRLNQMGIHVGDIIIVRRSGIMGGPVLIEVHGSEVAIGRGMAKKIIVGAVR